MSFEDVVCDANLLYSAFKKSIKGSKWKYASQKFEYDYLSRIFQIIDEIKTRRLQNDKAKSFVIYERGHKRLISSLSVKDKTIRHVLCDSVLMPEIRKRIIYDNGSSIKGRGLSFQRKRFETHIRKFYRENNNNGYILFGDFTKFYDNVRHDIAKRQLKELFDDDEFISWILEVIFEGFKLNATGLTDEEFSKYNDGVLNRLELPDKCRSVSKETKYFEKSVNIGDQLSQLIGIYYLNRIDTYVKTVKQYKYYGRYNDDWYIIGSDKSELQNILNDIQIIGEQLGIHINDKKTYIQPLFKPFSFLQIKYTLRSDGKLIKRIKTNKITKMKKKLLKLSRKVNSEKLDYKHVEAMFRSWMGAFYKYMRRSKRKGIIQFYEKLFNKKVTIQNRKLIIMD